MGNNVVLPSERRYPKILRQINVRLTAINVKSPGGLLATVLAKPCSCCFACSRISIHLSALPKALFKNVSDIEFFVDSPNTISNYWLNAVILKDKEAQIDFLTQTNDNGVMTRPIWELMNRLPMFENCENDGLENTTWFADRVVNIPSSVRCKDL